MSTLYLLRHAEAEGFGLGYSDRDRVLSDHGREQAAAVGETLRALTPSVQHILVSTAMRTRQTAELLKLGVNLTYADALYDAGPEQIAEEIGLIDGMDALLVVGHAPGIPYLVADLADHATSDPIALERLSRGWPTATLARIEVPSFDDILATRGRLTHVVRH